MSQNTLLLELGTEELPPKALKNLGQSLQSEFKKRLNACRLTFDDCKWYATPRRLALYVTGLVEKQKDQQIEVKGPSINSAYDDSGKPTKAALGWASSLGISLDEADTLKTDKGEWLYYKSVKQGENTADLIPKMFSEALSSLPIPKLMHWGDRKDLFVRPVHTLCMLYGDVLIEGSILGVASSRIIKGHRFLSRGDITLNHAEEYLSKLAEEGFVIADYEKRKAAIRNEVEKLASSINGVADLDDALLEEVTSLVENPFVYLATFEERFLEIPSEALVYTMKGDQKYFPIYTKEGKLMAQFAFVSNINPSDPNALISGNERVVRPRLSDAEFFFKTDRKNSLSSFHDKLNFIIYQKDIGTVAFRSEIVSQVACYIGAQIGADPLLCQRAAYLAKCDLATTLVSEFTDIQGIVGMHYAKLDSENTDVAEAIFHQYLPRFSGDKIPEKPVQIALSIAEKLVTLVGIFGINQSPKGDKDPYGLRRAAIGLIRIILENSLNINMLDAIAFTENKFSDKLKCQDTVLQVSNFIYGRLKSYYQDQGVGAEVFAAVLSNKPQNLLDFDKRIKAVIKFKELPEAALLASAFKRVTNILAKEDDSNNKIDYSLLIEKPEKNLVEKLNDMKPQLLTSYAEGDYESALLRLAELKPFVDSFFDNVMVNVDDIKVKNNRIAILRALSSIFCTTADISVLY